MDEFMLAVLMQCLTIQLFGIYCEDFLVEAVYYNIDFMVSELGYDHDHG